MPSSARFASRRSELILVEQPAEPIYEGGREVSRKPGRYHQFKEHQLRVEGQKSIDWIRQRAKAPDGPEIWELDGATDVPNATELLIELATADVRRVREILAAEEANTARPEVVTTARAVLEKMGAATRGPGSINPNPRHE